MCFYVDPTQDVVVNEVSKYLGFVLAWYLLPQDPKLSFKIYMALVKEKGLRDMESELSLQLTANFLAVSISYVLSIEFGDTVVTERLRDPVSQICEAKYFGPGDQFFGYFCHMDDDYPRGQTSALLMCSHVLTPGLWQRAFHNAFSQRRFSAPTVHDVQFPALGVSTAHNDTSGNLNVSGKSSVCTRIDGLLMCYSVVYAADHDRAGESTAFKVTNLRDKEAVHVRLNGELFLDWNWISENEIQIRYTVSDGHFVISTGYALPAEDEFVPVTIESASKL